MKKKITILKSKMMKKKEEIKYENIYKNLIFLLIQDEGMNIDLNKAMKDCEGIEKVQERTNKGVVSFINNCISYIFNYVQRQKFDSATYEKNKQEQGKK